MANVIAFIAFKEILHGQKDMASPFCIDFQRKLGRLSKIPWAKLQSCRICPLAWTMTGHWKILNKENGWDPVKHHILSEALSGS